MDAPAVTPRLLDRLKAETHALHLQAERSGVMGELIRRRIARRGYVALLANLHVVYRALESAQRRLRDPLDDAGLHFPDLSRADALQVDLTCLDPPGAGADAPRPVVAAARDYAQRLAGCDVPALVAHLYVRCLGDLHGGQVLASLVRAHFALAEGTGGTSFYDFGGPGAVAALRARWREQIARGSAGGVHDDRIVSEARWAFAAHVRMFEEIQATVAA